jgi:hypothetical protein
MIQVRLPICVRCRVFSHSIYRVETLLGQAEVERASTVRNCKGSPTAHAKASIDLRLPIVKTKLIPVFGSWELASSQWRTRGPTLMVSTEPVTARHRGWPGASVKGLDSFLISPGSPRGSLWQGAGALHSLTRFSHSFHRFAVLHHLGAYSLPRWQAHHLRTCLAWDADRPATRRRADGRARSVSPRSGLENRQVLKVEPDRAIL